MIVVRNIEPRDFASCNGCVDGEDAHVAIEAGSHVSRHVTRLCASCLEELIAAVSGNGLVPKISDDVVEVSDA